MKRYSPDGREIVGAFTEESRLRRNLAACRKYAALMADSLAVYERREAEQRTFLRNAGLCTEYRKRRREYNRQRKLIFSVYDRRPYEKLKRSSTTIPRFWQTKLSIRRKIWSGRVRKPKRRKNARLFSDAGLKRQTLRPTACGCVLPGRANKTPEVESKKSSCSKEDFFCVKESCGIRIP